MTRREEIVLAFISGFLLTFGIHDLDHASRPHDTREALKRDGQELANYWRKVGGFIRVAQRDEQGRQNPAGEPTV